MSSSNRGNISVTNLNYTSENIDASSSLYGNVRVSLPIPKMEESDEELSNIEKIAMVNMRKDPVKDDKSRPMSWEENENEEMTVDEKNDSIVQMPISSEDSKLQLVEDKKLLIKPEVCSLEGSSKQQLFLNANACTSNDYSKEPLANAPLRSKQTLVPANPSPDSAIHSIYTHSSPSQSPLANRHTPYTPSLSRNNSDASHSSYSYSSEFNSPTHSPIQRRHPYPQQQGFNSSLHHSMIYRPMMDADTNFRCSAISNEENNNEQQEAIPTAGISRQQLINSPCPICGDKISGFHYGIFSCESCKGFFKRTVQNRKNYVCLRGAICPVTIATRKKCPACRFEKCLQKGMKLEAIREDRTRGGRSTYSCSYTLPISVTNVPNQTSHEYNKINGSGIKTEPYDDNKNSCSNSSNPQSQNSVPSLLQEIMNVEYLWQFNDSELNRLNQSSADPSSMQNNPILASAGFSCDNPDMIATLCKIADHRLYKIVKWCKSLPLFKNISIDDQICLLINSWCELLLFSCCYRSIATPGEIKISAGKSISIANAKLTGLHACIERMLNLTDHLRRLKVDNYEYVAMKVIVLLSSDTADLKEPEKVRESQEKALQALQAYTLGHYQDTPAKFGELLLRIPELQRTCQVSKDMLTIKPKDGECSFNLLMELLRGEH